MESTDPDTTKKPRASWNEMMETYLIQLLFEYNTPAHRSQNAWSRKTWNTIQLRMKTRFPSANLTKQQIKDHEQSMKKIYRSLKSLSEMSAFGWDYENNMITASEEMWESTLQSNVAAKKWYKKPYPPFKALQDLYEGIVEGKGTETPSDHGGCSSPQPFPGSPPSLGDSPGEATPGYEGVRFEEHGNQVEDPQYVQIESPSIQSAPPPASPLVCITAPSPDRGTMKKKKRRYMGDDDFMQDYIWMRRQETNLFIEAMERARPAESKAKEDPYSISKCIFAFNELSGLTKEEMIKATLLFKDSSNREIFMALKVDQREVWLRAMFKLQEERSL